MLRQRYTGRRKNPKIPMLKLCGRCGKLHELGYKCRAGQVYSGGEERKLRATNKWTRKSVQIREDAQNLCEVCRAEGRYTFDNLEVHHITKLSTDKELLLEDDNLITLCQEHHKQADRGAISAEYLRKLALERMGRAGQGDERYPRGF